MEVKIPEGLLDYGLDSEVAVECAKENNLDVVLPDEYTLQLDIDTGTQYDNYRGVLSFFKQFFPIKSTRVIESKSGGLHKHIYIELEKPVTPLERIFLQLLLGSDKKRETYSFLRIQLADPRPTLLLEKRLK